MDLVTFNEEILNGKAHPFSVYTPTRQGYKVLKKILRVLN